MTVKEEFEFRVSELIRLLILKGFPNQIAEDIAYSAYMKGEYDGEMKEMIDDDLEVFIRDLVNEDGRAIRDFKSLAEHNYLLYGAAADIVKRIPFNESKVR